jgi:hypothetical protein
MASHASVPPLAGLAAAPTTPDKGGKAPGGTAPGGKAMGRHPAGTGPGQGASVAGTPRCDPEHGSTRRGGEYRGRDERDDRGRYRGRSYSRENRERAQSGSRGRSIRRREASYDPRGVSMSTNRSRSQSAFRDRNTGALIESRLYSLSRALVRLCRHVGHDNGCFPSELGWLGINEVLACASRRRNRGLAPVRQQAVGAGGAPLPAWPGGSRSRSEMSSPSWNAHTALTSAFWRTMAAR